MEPNTFTRPAGYEQLTIGVAASSLIVPPGASRAICTVEAQPIRYRDDKTVPTALVGMPVVSGVSFELVSRTSMIEFRAIRSGGVDAILNVNYYK